MNNIRIHSYIYSDYTFHILNLNSPLEYSILFYFDYNIFTYIMTFGK